MLPDVGLCCVSSSIMSPPLCFVHTFSHSLIHPSQLSHDNACTPQAYLVDRLDSCVGRCPRFAVQIRRNHVGVQSSIRAQCARVAGSKLAHAVTISCCSTGCSHLRTRRWWRWGLSPTVQRCRSWPCSLASAVATHNVMRRVFVVSL
jgi:hypothetical protein